MPYNFGSGTQERSVTGKPAYPLTQVERLQQQGLYPGGAGNNNANSANPYTRAPPTQLDRLQGQGQSGTVVRPNPAVTGPTAGFGAGSGAGTSALEKLTGQGNTYSSTGVIQNGMFIRFPTTIDAVKEVLWVQNDNNGSMFKSAIYYLVPVFFSPNSTFTGASGKTTMFVQAEWYDPIYFHPKAPMMWESTQPHVRGFKEVPGAEDWVYTQVDSRFFYGQDSAKNTQKRWIVYHLPTRNIYQGQFTSTLLSSIVITGASVLGDLAQVTNDTVRSRLITLGSSALGDPLWQFGRNYS